MQPHIAKKAIAVGSKTQHGINANLDSRRIRRMDRVVTGVFWGHKSGRRRLADNTDQLSMQFLGMLLREGEANSEEAPEEGEVGLEDLADDDDAEEPGESCAPRRRRG